MITEENLVTVISLISDKDRKRIWRSMKEYCVLYFIYSPTGSTTKIRLTDDNKRYENIEEEGNKIMLTEDVIEVLNSFEDLNEQFDYIFND